MKQLPKIFFNPVKELKTNWTPKCFVAKGTTGKVLTKMEDVTERWRQCREELYNHQASTLDDYLNDFQQAISMENFKEPLMKRESSGAGLKKLKPNKFPGTGNILTKYTKSSHVSDEGMIKC